MERNAEINSITLIDPPPSTVQKREARVYTKCIKIRVSNRHNYVAKMIRMKGGK